MRILTIPEKNLRDLEKSVYYINYEPPRRIKNQLLDSCMDDIRDRYNEYDIHESKLENIPESVYTKESNETLYNSLFDLYDSKESLKTTIRENSGVRCPYCGITESPFHVDHFLPRSKFPEFSIYAHNLIAACASCNSRYKGDDFVVDGKRQFFNPYFDSFFENNKFLNCSLSVDNIYLVVDFYIDTALKVDFPYEYKIIKRHFKNLNLKIRYKNLITIEIFRKFKDEYFNPITREIDDVTFVDIKRDIIKKLRGFHAYNDNHWEKVFWHSLLECDECLKLIVEKKIPFDNEVVS